jgi:hypothetical protein
MKCEGIRGEKIGTKSRVGHVGMASSKVNDGNGRKGLN